MSIIKTITATLIKRVLEDDFDAGVLVSDEEARKEAAKINPAEVQELINRLESVIPIVRPFYIEQAKQTATNTLNALRSSPEIKALLGGFDSLDEVLQLAGAVKSDDSAKSTKAKTKTSTDDSDKNKKYIVRWNQTDKTTNVTTPVEYGVIIEQIKKNKINENQFFITWMNKNDNNLHEFMYQYCEEYKAECKYTYKDHHFMLNESGRGAMKVPAKAAYHEWLRDVGKEENTATRKEFRELVMK